MKKSILIAVAAAASICCSFGVNAATQEDWKPFYERKSVAVPAYWSSKRIVKECLKHNFDVRSIRAYFLPTISPSPLMTTQLTLDASNVNQMGFGFKSHQHHVKGDKMMKIAPAKSIIYDPSASLQTVLREANVEEEGRGVMTACVCVEGNETKLVNNESASPAPLASLFEVPEECKTSCPSL